MAKKVWETPDPTKKDKKLSPKKKAAAKASAKAAGRPYPNLVDNMNAAKEEEVMSQESRRALFHGSIENLKPGTMIEPLGGATKRAYATSNVDEAVEHTRQRVKTGFSQQTMGNKNPHHGYIYEVEPVEGDTTLTDANKSEAFKGAVHSERGFRVSRQIASVLHPDPEARKTRDPLTNKPYGG